jgi:hypothetical protein
VDTRDRFAYLGAVAPKPATFDLEVMQAVWEVEDAKLTVRELISRGLLDPVGNVDSRCTGCSWPMRSLCAA